jgi:hypothetical protein
MDDDNQNGKQIKKTAHKPSALKGLAAKLYNRFYRKNIRLLYSLQ